MSSILIHMQAKPHIRAVPDIQPGYTVRVHEKVQEGSKERIQIFEGLVISVHKGHVPTDASFVVRKVVSGIGVEKIFALHSPILEKIDVKKVAKTRRAKLFFIRGRTGKSARMLERFTNEGEFDVAIAPAPQAIKEEEILTETPVATEPAAEESKTETTQA